MNTTSRAVTYCFLSILSLTIVCSAARAVPPLQVSSNGRFLVQQGGTPFFWQGDTNWRLYKLSDSEVNAYMNNRAGKGFNVIQGPVLLTSDDGVDSLADNGVGNFDPRHPNEEWFQHIDSIVDAAGQRGMYIALIATWGDNSGAFASTTVARQYGEFLGRRYRDRNNVIWIVAGEYSINGVSTQTNMIWRALAQGIEAGSGGRQLITVHGGFAPGLQSSSRSFQNASWLDFNMIQSGQSGNSGPGAANWKLVTTDFLKTPAKPTIDGEANYEGLDGWGAYGVRRRAYWSVFAGAFGHTYGANGVWQSYRGGDDSVEGSPNDTWDVAIHYIGSWQMRHLRHLMESRPMLNRFPAQFVLLSAAGDVPYHIQATRDYNGRYIMTYVPRTNTSFTVDMTKISGAQAKAWWYNPRNGKATAIGVFPTNGPHTFKTPSVGPDWVLVLDDASRNYPPPGQGGPLR